MWACKNYDGALRSHLWAFLIYTGSTVTETKHLHRVCESVYVFMLFGLDSAASCQGTSCEGALQIDALRQLLTSEYSLHTPYQPGK